MNTDTHISTEPEASEPQALSARVIAALGYEPNDQQRAVIDALARFVAPLTHPQAQTGPDVDAVFVLNGYAGTGKTSLTAALTRALADIKVPSILMAPTGRAAKVFAGYAHHTAYTIHRKIYRHSLGGEVPGLQENKAVGTLFIVDEASMISGGDPQGREDLLGDLIQYVYAGQGCRMLLIGDTAQLPPVGMDRSPAMDPEVLHAYGLRVSRATLTAIARQRADSGILANATMLRRAMRDAAAGRDELRMPTLLTNGFSDIDITSPEDLPEAIESAYRDHGIDHTLVITRSNMRASAFNRAIRADVLYIDTAIAKGEPLIVVKNNYRCARSVKGLDFVANGDMAIVSHIYSTETRYGMHWADVRLALTDRNIEFDANHPRHTRRRHPGTVTRKARQPRIRHTRGIRRRRIHEPAPTDDHTQCRPVLRCVASQIRIHRHLPQSPRRPMESRLRRHVRHSPRRPHGRLLSLALHRRHPRPPPPHHHRPTTILTTPRAADRHFQNSI